MKSIRSPLGIILIAAVHTSCASIATQSSPMRTGAAEAASLSADEANPEARRIQTGSQQVEVTNVGTAVSAARDIVRRAGGRVESSSVRVSDTEERGTAEMQIRVAATDLEETADALAGLGHETFRRIEDQDVAVQWIDLEAQLQNQIALRDQNSVYV